MESRLGLEAAILKAGSWSCGEGEEEEPSPSAHQLQGHIHPVEGAALPKTHKDSLDPKVPEFEITLFSWPPGSSPKLCSGRQCHNYEGFTYLALSLVS
jgi:hypothetical protein